MSFTESPVCTSRKSCWACRGNPSWRAAFNAPDVCPFGVGPKPKDDFTEAFLAAARKADPPPPPVEGRVLVEEEIQAFCKGCKLMAPDGCRQCGCKDAKVRPWAELSKCPKGYWTKRYSDGTIG